MTLTTNGKNYIAQNFGISNCCVSSGLEWTAVANDDTTVNETGGTASIVARLVTTSVYKRIDLTSPRVASYTYANLKQANDNTDVVMTDAQWVAANDGSPVGEAQHCYVAPTTGSIAFSSSPSGADIYLDGTLQSSAKTPTTITGVSSGTHPYTLKLTGYEDANGIVTVIAGETVTVSITLIPITTTGNIAFSSTPSGADIYLDGTLQSVMTPSTITDVSTGSHSYTLKLTGYNDASGTVSVVAGETSTISATLTPVTTTGSISFSSSPSGADIYFDGVNMGVITPVTLTKVLTGSHSYILKLYGYEDASGTVTVVAGETSYVLVTLTSTCVPNWQCEQPLNGYEFDGCGNRRLNPSCNPAAGRISFESSPSGAEVYLDGVNRLVLTPATLTNIPAGAHFYTLKLSGHIDTSGMVTVVYGKTVTVSVTLTPICVPDWLCEFPLNGYENDGCGNRQLSSTCDPTMMGVILFETSPADAEIFIDDVDTGRKTPFSIPVIAGVHTITLKLSGYVDVSGTTTVNAGETWHVFTNLTPVESPSTSNKFIIGITALGIGILGITMSNKK